MKNFKLYKPEENAEQEISAAIKKQKLKKNKCLFKLEATGVFGVQDLMIL
jgi:hypothetical protein